MKRQSSTKLMEAFSHVGSLLGRSPCYFSLLMMFYSLLSLGYCTVSSCLVLSCLCPLVHSGVVS
jgi:hypothetical protein